MEDERNERPQYACNLDNNLSEEKKGKSVNMCIKNTNTSPRKKNRKSSKILATDIERGMKMRVLKKLKVLSIFDNTFDFHLQIYMLITYRLLKHCVG